MKASDNNPEYIVLSSDTHSWHYLGWEWPLDLGEHWVHVFKVQKRTRGEYRDIRFGYYCTLCDKGASMSRWFLDESTEGQQAHWKWWTLSRFMNTTCPENPNSV